MARKDKKFFVHKEDQEVEAKLEELEREFYSHQKRMRQAAQDYENLLGDISSVLSSIAVLKKFRNERRRNAFSESCNRSK